MTKNGWSQTDLWLFVSFVLSFFKLGAPPLTFDQISKRKRMASTTHTKKRHCASGTFLFRVFVGWQNKQRATFALLKREHNKANWQIPSIVAAPLFFFFVYSTVLAKIERGGRKALDQFNKLFRCCCWGWEGKFCFHPNLNVHQRRKQREIRKLGQPSKFLPAPLLKLKCSKRI